MRKYILAIIIFLFCGLVAPAMSSAAYNTVTYDADTYVYLNDVGITLIIGNGAKVASMTVYGSYLTVGLESGSSMVITSNDRYMLNNDGGFTTNCGGTSSSSLTLTATSTVTVTITPSGTCASTGGGGPSGGAVQEAVPEPEAPAAETATGQATVTAAAGGSATATTDEGGQATVQVPANAVSADTVITITPIGTAQSIAGSPPAGSFMVGGYVYQFSATANGQAVTSFDQELTLTFTYTDDQIEDLDESSLTVYRWDETASEWVALTSTVDAVNNTVTATTTEFSEFALMGEEEEEVAVGEMTIEELKAEIARLKVLIAEVQAKLAALLGETVITDVPAGFSFETNLQVGMSANDVKYLQLVLNSNVDTRLAVSGVGSPGNETNFFGYLTKEAVIKFQEKYSSDILTPWNLTGGTGYVGSKTREKLNSLLAQ